MGSQGSKAEPYLPIVANVDEWGNIEDILRESPTGVTPDETWFSVICFALLAPLYILLTLLAGTCDCIYYYVAWGSYTFYKWGHPWLLSPLSWVYQLLTLYKMSKLSYSRTAFWAFEQKIFGGGDHWWRGDGVWCGKYAEVDSILRGNQERKPVFFTRRAPTPDIFPERVLVFLPNNGPDSEWLAISRVVHAAFFDLGSETLQARIKELRGRVAAEWPNPQLSDLDDGPRMHRLVGKMIFYVLTGIWLDDADASVLAAWIPVLGYFAPLRFVQRLFCNSFITKIKQARIDTVRLFEKHNLQHVFFKLNEQLPPKYRRFPVVRLCDELTFGIGFAGVGGACGALASIAAFLRCQLPGGRRAGDIDFGQYKTPEFMAAAYRQNPEQFIRETLRLDPPVTTCASSFDKETKVTVGGHDLTVPEGTIREYVLAFANRDPTVFPDPDRFDPTRSNLNQALTWNGAFGVPGDEDKYPRLCPGRKLALVVERTVFDHVLGLP